MTRYTLAEARRELAPLGIAIHYNSFDEYMVRPAHLTGRAAADAAYFTDDLNDAVQTGIRMACAEASAAMHSLP